MDKSGASDELRIGPVGSPKAVPPHPFLLLWVYPLDHRHGCPFDQIRNLCNTFSHSALSLRHHHAPFQLMVNFDEGIMFRPLRETRCKLLGRTNFQSSLPLGASLSHEWHLTYWLTNWLAGWLILAPSFSRYPYCCYRKTKCFIDTKFTGWWTCLLRWNQILFGFVVVFD
jgi:hypothetical protein